MKKRTAKITIMNRTAGLIFAPDSLWKLLLRPYEEGDDDDDDEGVNGGG